MFLLGLPEIMASTRCRIRNECPVAPPGSSWLLLAPPGWLVGWLQARVRGQTLVDRFVLPSQPPPIRHRELRLECTVNASKSPQQTKPVTAQPCGSRRRVGTQRIRTRREPHGTHIFRTPLCLAKHTLKGSQRRWAKRNHPRAPCNHTKQHPLHGTRQ